MGYKKDIESFDGQYLKCVVTKHKSLFENNKYLANSGSLIIYQPPYSQIDRNYIYLGSEFLASGYGFSTEALEQQAERIVNRYDDDIKNLRKEDESLSNRLTTEVNTLLEKMNEYVKIDGGFIENTYININGQPIRTLDIILFGEEAKYENLEITSHKIFINDVEVKDGVVFLPIGSLIKTIDVYIEYKINDSGGIEMIQVVHKGLNEENSDEKIIVEYNDTGDGYIYNSEFNLGTISYTKSLTDEVYVDKYYGDAISNMYVSVKQTPESAYKNYPGIESNLKISIPSTGNAIKANIVKVINNVSIRPQYRMYWAYDFNYEDLSNKPILLNSFVDYDRTTVMIDVMNAEYNSYVYFAVPTEFAIQKIYVIKDNIERYNWTGSVEIRSNVQLRAYNNKSLEKNKTIPYNVYRIYAGYGFDFLNTNNIKLELDIIYNKEKIVDNKDGNINPDGEYSINLINEDENVANSLSSFTLSTNRLINDEEFNNMYWVNGSSVKSEEELPEFESHLVTMNENGASRIPQQILRSIEIAEEVQQGVNKKIQSGVIKDLENLRPSTPSNSFEQKAPSYGSLFQ